MKTKNIIITSIMIILAIVFTLFIGFVLVFPFFEVLDNYEDNRVYMGEIVDIIDTQQISFGDDVCTFELMLENQTYKTKIREFDCINYNYGQHLYTYENIYFVYDNKGDIEEQFQKQN